MNMMKAKNELFGLLSTFCLHASFFRLNINFDYNMYEYSEVIKKFNHHIRKLENIYKEQERLTQNILIDFFKRGFESDDFLNYNILDSAFNFFLINSYYKYSNQIALENDIS